MNIKLNAMHCVAQAIAIAVRSACLAVTLWLLAAGAAIAETACVDVRIQTHGAGSDDLALVRTGIERAAAFFEMHELALRPGITLHLRPDGIANKANHIGLYDAADARIDLITFSRSSEHAAAFHSPMSRSVYASFVTHELAHALAEQYFSDSGGTLVAHEYFAYVAQLASLPAADGRQILARYPIEGFTDIDEISPMYYLLDPCAFGVKAYLHYRDLPDKRGFIAELLAGDTGLSGDLPEWW